MKKSTEKALSHALHLLTTLSSFQALENLLGECNLDDFFNNDLIQFTAKVNAIDDNNFENLQEHFNCLRNCFIDSFSETSQEKSNDELHSFSKLLSVIFRVSSIIQIHNPNKDQSSGSERSMTLQNQLVSTQKKLDSVTKQLQTASEASQREVFNAVADRFSFEKTAITNTQSLLDSLEQIKNKNANTDISKDDLVQEMILSFELPSETTSLNIIPEIQRKIDILKSKISYPNHKAEVPLSESSPLNSSEDPEDPSIPRNRLISTIQNLRIELDCMKGDLADQNEILQVFRDIPIETEEINKIIEKPTQTGFDFLQKIRKITSLLMVEVFRCEDTKILNQNLLSLLLSLFHFVNSLGTSKSAYCSIDSNIPFEEIRKDLLLQAERIQLFLGENAQGFIETQKSLFDDLISGTFNNLNRMNLKQLNSTDLITHVQAFLAENNQPPTTVEGQRLFIVAIESILACDILRRYSSEAKRSLITQSRHANQLKDYANQLEKSIQEHQVYINDMNSTPQVITIDDKDVPEKIKQVRSILRSALIENTKNKCHSKNCRCVEKILESLKYLNNDSLIADSEYIQDLQNQLNTSLEQNKQTLKETRDDFIKVQKRVKKMKDTMTNKIEQVKNENKILTKALREATDNKTELENHNKTLTEMNQQLDEQLKHANQAMKEANEQSEKLIETIQSSFQETKDDYENQLRSIKANVEEYQDQKQKEFDTMKEQLEETLKSSERENEELKGSMLSLNKRIEELENDLKEKNSLIENLEKNEEDAIEQAAKIALKYQEIHKDFTVIEDQKNRMTTKCESMEKEQNMFQGSLKGYRETLENFESLRKKYDQFINDSVKQEQQYLSKISSLFPSYTDLNVVLSKENVYGTLTKVKEAVCKIPEFERKIKKYSLLIQTIKQALQIESDEAIPEKINVLLSKIEQLKEGNNAVISEMKALQDSRVGYLQMEDWLIRIYVLLTGGVCQDVTTIQMQHTLEDSIMSSYENLILARKNAILRAEKTLLTSKAFEPYIKKVDNGENTSEMKVASIDDVSNTSPEKKKKSKKGQISMRHLLIVAMLILKAKNLSGNGGDQNKFDLNEDQTKTAIEIEDDNNIFAISPYKTVSGHNLV